MIIFQNPGLIDMRAVVTMGVNVKDDPESAIGFFGTGLKYAIAVLLRHKQNITVYRGTAPFVFDAAEVEVRGKTFSFVTMNGRELGFTTELGKTWELWMAYRELFCNARDEQGEAFEAVAPPLHADKTTIVVEGDAFAKEHHARSEFILDGTPDLANDDLEVRFKPSKHIYYKGIRVGTLPYPAQNTYNLLGHVELTEDRTVKNQYQLAWRVGGPVARMTDQAFLERTICPLKGSFEGSLDFDYGHQSEAFLDAAERCVRHQRTDMNSSARMILKRRRPKSQAVGLAKLTNTQRQQLATATEFCLKMGFPITDYPIVCAERLGDGVLGLASEGTIYVTKAAFEMGTKIVAGTLIEEFIHLHEKHEDCSRGLQDFLLNRLVSLGEQFIWERPL